jgi:4-hydroxybutyryl-CoA dehydratase/vinylacetyl-CoA-Delta-isomerase
MLMSGAQYKQSLDDGRRVYIDGERVVDLFDHPVLAIPARQIAEAYDRGYRSDPEAVNSALAQPRTPEALRLRSEMEVDSLTGITFACAMTLLTAGERIAAARPQGQAAIRRFVETVQRQDLRMTECITDAKGDRSLSPSKQADPDAYLRVVARRDGGVVIRGAKLHVSLAALGHELMVIPTKAMKPEEAEFAIACAVPVAADGVKIVVVGEPPHGDIRDWPVAARRYIPQCFVIFDDVFVPNERIFLEGEAEHAATFAHSLGLWLRATSLVRMAREADALVGFAQLVAEANGLEKVAHVREKISDMVLHATLIRATVEAAMATGTVQDDGSVLPNELYANAGKYLAAADHSLMVRHLLDIAGGSALTAPSNRDFENPEVGELLRKYMTGKPSIDGLDRARLFHAIRDISVSSHGGAASVARLQGAGGLYAQRVVSRARYDMARAKRLARAAAGLGGSNAPAAD